MAEKRPTVIRPEKVAAVKEVADCLDRAEIAVLADYRGLSVAQMTDLRRQLAPIQSEMRVAKNTLVKLAIRGTAREVMSPALEGPTAFVFGYGDPSQTAKAFTDIIRTQRLQVPIKGALLGDRLLSAAEVGRLAELPSRAVLIAQVVGGIQAPLALLVNVLSGTLQNFLGVLEARRQQLEDA
ncbi:MAG: 50S ribosomal protein L10 [Chloroflexi bacterium]|nr:50S ribosomal protein L10 [Chloroflexota bacterium]